MFYGILNLLCGLGIFLYGINIMSEKTQTAFGEKIKLFLKKTANNKFTSILTGTLITALVQSSSAVTVTVVSFIESGLMNLYQAVGIIMGANIGTTVTSMLIAFNFSDLAPIAVFIGAFIMLFAEKKSLKYTGEALIGFGLLFIGLNLMSEAFTHLKDNPVFINMIISSSGKVGGILSGTLMTVILQSSSATVGILQSLCNQGLVSINDGIYIVLGQNIGTVITVILATIGKSKAAKQAGIIHLLFNLIGSGFFILICEFIPVPQLLSHFGSPSMQISAFHIIFNIVNTIILIPFFEQLIKMAEALTGKNRKRKNKPAFDGLVQ